MLTGFFLYFFVSCHIRAVRNLQIREGWILHKPDPFDRLLIVFAARLDLELTLHITIKGSEKDSSTIGVRQFGACKTGR